jgi:hypothetical protein
VRGLGGCRDRVSVQVILSVQKGEREGGNGAD